LRQPSRRKAIHRRAMAHDWSWTSPAEEHLGHYRALLDPGHP
jgi:hypothetical protein